MVTVLSDHPAFSVTLTVAELAVLARLDGHRLPPVIGPPDEGGVDPIRVDEAIASLVGRDLLTIEGEECFAPAALRHLLRLVCEPSWLVEAIAADATEIRSVLRVSGTGVEGAMLVADGGAVLLSFRPDARDATSEALNAALMAWAPPPAAVAAEPPSPVDAMAADPGWELRRMFAVAATAARTAEVTALDLGGVLYLLEGEAADVSARGVGLAEVSASVAAVLAVLRGSLEG